MCRFLLFLFQTKKKQVIYFFKFSFSFQDEIVVTFICKNFVWLLGKKGMEFNSSVNMILPDSINLIENDFDDEDILHEQTNQNEVKT